MTAGGGLSRSAKFGRASDASETERDNEPVGLLDELTVPLRGMGTGVRDFGTGSSRDTCLVSKFVLDEVTVDVVFENDQLSTDLENASFPLNGTSGGVESLLEGDVPVIRSRFLGVEDRGCALSFNPRSRGGVLPGDKTSVSKEEDAEK